MIKLIENGNMFESLCEAWVNPVNCVGVMGAGLAKSFKNEFPDYYSDYKLICSQLPIKPGSCWYYKNSNPGPKYIMSFTTKGHWKEKSNLNSIKSGILELKEILESLRINSVAIPALGCGLGGLNWKDVLPIIESIDSKEIFIEIYKPK